MQDRGINSIPTPSASGEINNFHRILLETIPLGIDIVDKEGRIVFFNKRWGEAFGKEAIGKKCWDVTKDNKKQCDHCPLKNGGFLQEVKDFETTGVNGGKTFQIIHAGIRYRGENAILKLFYDITERKQSEEELARLAGELERSNKELEQFACVCSHELQEPLRMVASYTNLLARRYKGKLDQDADDFIKYAVDGASRMQLLLQDLLIYARIGKCRKEFVRVDCNDVLKRVLTTLGMMIEEHGAVITYQSLPVVLGDEIELEQVFENIITNALKFCDNAPRIHIKAERQPPDVMSGDNFRPFPSGSPAGEPRPNGGAERRNDEWLFSVKDNGIGIAPEYAERIFVIFQQVYDKHKYLGTGVGLAICKKVIECHGGRIWVESGAGQGATFYFTIPDRIGKTAP
ncbi:MAG: ATP-binding protein [Planctomycetota bacterium]